ncbi:MAG: ABC transporter substrate-binding protein [Methyloceanibacter sp.]|nr:ABC transporter substrate-binding protein [Methyloceanibacter sp.]
MPGSSKSEPESLKHVVSLLRRWPTTIACFGLALLLASDQSAASADLEVTIGYLERVQPPVPVLSNLETTPADQGLAGAELGVADNNKTGKFLGQTFMLKKRVVDHDEDLLGAARELLGRTKLLLLDMTSEDLLAVADLPEAKGALLINISEGDVSLRDKSCRKNLLHTIPSRAMLADALSQFAVQKKWTRWALVEGPEPEDKAFAEALDKSTEKFDIDIRGRKVWGFGADMRRNAAQEVPLFVQSFPEHDLLVVTDERGDFGRYLLYNGWIPRPVAGSEGLRPDAWSGAVEQHGAAQLQRRFKSASGRSMRAIDYAAWAAVRAIGEAVTQTKSNDPVALRAYILSDDFELAGYKGRKLSFRPWNGQLRQPIPLTHPRAVVAQAPLEGFLHQLNEMDTLGIDRAESRCTSF